MRIHSELCHIDNQRVIVKITGFINQSPIGSILAEGSSVDEAQKKGIQEITNIYQNQNYAALDHHDLNNNSLSNPIESKTSDNKSESPQISIHNNTPIEEVSQNTKEISSTNDNQIPTDWSNELLKIDIEIKRLNWTKEQEDLFISNKLGLRERTRISSYNDLINYLSLLRKESDSKLNHSSDNVNIRLNLIESTNRTLAELKWNTVKARKFLVERFGVNSREMLSEKQLLEFNSLLKELVKTND